MLNERRIRRAMKISYVAARAAVSAAREAAKYGNTLAYKAALEMVQYHRKLNRDRRLALAKGHMI